MTMMKRILITTIALAAQAQNFASAGYCNWGPNGDAASSTCDGSVQGGEWCNASEQNCEGGCGGRWCTSTAPPPPPPPPPPSGQQATTSRYWDCAGGSCGCSYVPNGLNNPDNPAHCPSNAMFVAPAGNPYGASFYGAAAISKHLGGGPWMSEGCGKCWKVTGTSNIAGFAGVDTTLVLKGTNFCPDENPGCRAGPHFDIAAPGFDVLEYSLAHDCPFLMPEEADGFASCGRWMIDSQNPSENCDCSFFHSPALRAGCDNFYNLKWDNPTVQYEEVACPVELSSLHCGYPYPNEADMPATCASNLPADTPTTPPEDPTPECVNDKWFRDTGCEKADYGAKKVCVLESGSEPERGQAGDECVVCINTKASPGLKDRGCPTKTPNCVLNGGLPDLGKPGTECIA